MKTLGVGILKKSVTIVYNNGDYEVRHHQNFRGNRKYRIVNLKNPDLHTHRRGEKESIDLCNFAKYGSIPHDADIDYLKSLSRILCNGNPTKKKVDGLIQTKVGKKKGNQRHYINIQRGAIGSR